MQLKTVLELCDMEIHLKISMPNCQIFEDDGEEKYRSETPITARENRDRSSGQESKGIKWLSWRKRKMLPVERKMPVFEGRPVQFPA